ncbi:flagellar hook-length control protein FliK [Metabacillus indicus]|uniref:flagellar hook-length control protein FliK n=1 Tax=Metabacillus indicus TaxID=246786 RepID=UPI002A045E20|nr:flagellar hook-length control protein FliK [Metabacillus indicus]MDX8288367.1 flagellar hook-length control protein FliK [Metabacillus indicus]
MKITFPAGPVSLMNNDGKAGSGVQVSFLSLLLGSAGAAGSTETEGQSDIFDEKTENADPELEAAFKELIKELGINEAFMPEGSEYGLPPLPLAAEQTISKQTKTGLGRFLKKETETAAEQAVYPEITRVKNGAGEISAPESEAGFSGRVAPILQAKTGAISENMTNAHASPEAQLQQTKKTANKDSGITETVGMSQYSKDIPVFPKGSFEPFRAEPKAITEEIVQQMEKTDEVNMPQKAEENKAAEEKAFLFTGRTLKEMSDEDIASALVQVDEIPAAVTLISETKTAVTEKEGFTGRPATPQASEYDSLTSGQESSAVQNQSAEKEQLAAQVMSKNSEPLADLLKDSQHAGSITRHNGIVNSFRGHAQQTLFAGSQLFSTSSNDETIAGHILTAIKQAVSNVLELGHSDRTSQSKEDMDLNNQPERTGVSMNAIDKLAAILKPLHRIFSAGGEQVLARLIEEISAAVSTDSGRTISSLKNLQSQLEGNQILQLLQKASYTEKPDIGRLPLKKEIEPGGGKQEAVHQLLNKGYFRPAAAESSNGNRPQVPESIGNFQADLKQLEVNVTENHMRSPGLPEMKNEWQQLFNKDGNSTVHQPSPGLTEVKLNASPELKENQEEPVKREFSAQITEVFKRAKPAFALNGFSQMTIRLAPEHLGLLTVKLQRLNGETTAKIITSTSSAKELVEQSIQHLKAALPAFQIAVDRFDVYGEQPDTFRERHQDERQPEKEQGEEKDHAEEPDSFKDHLNMLT